MFVITYQAVNNDTYEDNIFILHCNPDPNNEESKASMFFDSLPEKMEEAVEATYDGVWVPQTDSIKVFVIKEVTDWK